VGVVLGKNKKIGRGKNKKILLAVTGASAMLYIPQLLDLLCKEEVTVHGIISQCGRQVMELELGIDPDELSGISRWFGINDFAAPPSSGSSRYHGMVVLPCTTGTLGAIAAGYCGNLIHRAADVTLKEKRPLLLAVRETPLSRIHLENMLRVQEAGAIICPPMPSFYLRPRNMDDMARNFAARICDLLGIAVVVPRWDGQI
jgi:4-hydroxy-3-polyprenylbenzoate decarboxylase